MSESFENIVDSMIHFYGFNYLYSDKDLQWAYNLQDESYQNKAHVLSSVQETLKYHFSQIWFNACAIIRMSSTWPCCGNLASAAIWRDLQILKSADAHLVSGGMETEECAVWEVFGWVWSRVCPSVCTRLSLG